MYLPDLLVVSLAEVARVAGAHRCARGFAPAVELRDEPWLSDFFAEPPLTVEFQGQTVPVLSRSRWGVIRHRDHAAGVAGRRAHLRTDAEWAAILG